MSHTIPPHHFGRPPAVYPLIAQLAGWCAVVVAAGAAVDRSRYADLGGAVAAPVSFAAIVLAWYLPASARLLVTPPATARGVTIGWYAIATVAVAMTAAAMRDHWHRWPRWPGFQPQRSPGAAVRAAAPGRRRRCGCPGSSNPARPA